jgi:hypothetical protein
LVASLLEAAEEAQAAADKVDLIVQAAITASDQALTAALEAATAADAGSKSSAAQSIAASNFETYVDDALTTLNATSSLSEDVAFSELSGLVDNVTLKVQSSVTLAASGPASVSEVLAVAENAATQAGLAANNAFSSIRETDPTKAREFAETALSYATASKGFSDAAGDLVDTTQIALGLDASITDEFLSAVEKQAAGQRELDQAASAIESATDFQGSATAYIDGTAQANLDAASSNLADNTAVVANESAATTNTVTIAGTVTAASATWTA